MSYTYNDKTKKVHKVRTPKVSGEDAIRMEKSKTPKEFINKIMNMDMKVIQVS